MATEQTREAARKVMERLDQRDLEGLLAQAAPDAKWHGFAPVTLDNNGYRQAISEFLNGFPDSRFPIESVIAEGNKAAVRHSLRGTHNGIFQGIPPTGRQVIVNGVAEFQVEDGKIVETWLHADLLGMLTQLGVVPTPDQ